MRGWSIPLGRWFGVEMRVHIFFPLLVLVLFAISGADGWPRAWLSFFILVAAVAVRETARLVVAAWLGLRLRAILLLAHRRPVRLRQSGEPGDRQPRQRAICSCAGRPAGKHRRGAHRCRHHPWRQRRHARSSIIPSSPPRHLLRSLVWMQASLGILHFFPAYPLDCGRLIRNKFARNPRLRSRGPRRLRPRPGAGPGRHARRHAGCRSPGLSSPVSSS